MATSAAGAAVFSCSAALAGSLISPQSSVCERAFPDRGPRHLSVSRAGGLQLSRSLGSSAPCTEISHNSSSFIDSRKVCAGAGVAAAKNEKTLAKKLRLVACPAGNDGEFEAWLAANALKPRPASSAVAVRNVEEAAEFKLYEATGDEEGWEEMEDEDEDDDDFDEDDDPNWAFEDEGSAEAWAASGDESSKPKKQRSVPAIVRCFDRARICVKAGDGGNGAVAFRREKFVPLGGPAGGHGGRGGRITLQADKQYKSLLPFRRTVHFKAGRGAHGGGKNCDGAAGKDVVIKVPVGTVVRIADEDDIIVDLKRHGQSHVILEGGAGGRGNSSFKSGRNKAPTIAENGEEGAELWLDLEMKLVADVGLIGVPNAGKSTMLSAVTSAKPKIAAYPFTTLVPNLGVCEQDYMSTVFADIPGLLEGAHQGRGLGLEFLRHCERCRVLVHMVDGTSPDPVGDFDAVVTELELFNPTLLDKPMIVAYNKMDVPEAAEKWPEVQRELEEMGHVALPVSAVTGDGRAELIRAVRDMLAQLEPSEADVVNAGGTVEEDCTPKAKRSLRPRGPDVRTFAIEYDNEERVWEVRGAGLERFVQMTNWEYYEAAKRFQLVLQVSGVNKELKRQGVKENDTIVIGKYEFVWHDDPNHSSKYEDWNRKPGTYRGSAAWPH
eukprot:jgi/Mesvir1/14403/Mv09789-RA.1